MDNIVALVVVVLFFLFLLGWRFFEDFKKLECNQNMFKKIAYIAERDDGHIMTHRSNELWYYIMQEQHALDLPKKLCIDFRNETEKKDVEKILDLHKERVIKFYFNDSLIKSKDICKLNSLEYYFFSLYSFICSKVDKPIYDRNEIGGEIYKDREYIDEFSYKYQLTDYGRTYYKLYLITLMFLEKNEKTRKLFEYIDPKEKDRIVEYLEKNEITFFKY